MSRDDDVTTRVCHPCYISWIKQEKQSILTFPKVIGKSTISQVIRTRRYDSPPWQGKATRTVARGFALSGSIKFPGKRVLYIEQTNRELHKLTIGTRTVQILQAFRIRVSKIPTISITFHHIGNPQICREYLAEKGEGGFSLALLMMSTALTERGGCQCWP